MRKLSQLLLGFICVSLFGITLAMADTTTGKGSRGALSLNPLYRPAGNAIAGNPQGEITMVEFFDYNCGYCRLMYSKVQNMIEQNKNLRVIFREYPVLTPKSILPARAALAAQKQGKYAELHEAMMNAKMPLDQNEIIKLAQSAKINPTQLLKDMQSPQVDRQIALNLEVGKMMNIQGVPTFIVARTTPPSKRQPQVVVGPSISDLEDMVKQAENG